MSEQGPDKAGLTGETAGTVSSASAQAGSAADIAKTIGAMLQEARLAQQLPLDEISVRLKVPVARLALVEKGDLDGLLDVTFAQGLMRAYGRVLDVDLGDLPARLKSPTAQATLGLRPETGLGQKFSGRSSMDRPAFRLRWLWIALALIAVCAVLLFSLDRMRGWLAGQSDVLDTVAVTATPVPEAAPPGANGANEQGTVATLLPAAALQQGASAPVAASASDASAVPVAAATPTTAVTAAGDIVMQFSEPVWYEVRDHGGKVIASGTARAGEEQVLSGTAPYSFVFGNARGVAALKVGGQSVDISQFARNNVARMKLPQ
ncbi:helix-turn-helix domain-containing protein [Imbroritus primus]|uniref:helix-turn-helix domain-containing protein n=1 Tax=Imbroritus primus TaxID=3058603 RepID=UPI003D160FD7